MSQCEAYVKWVRGKSDQWATWEPGERVSAGDIGTFSRNLQFQSSLSVTLNDLGVVPKVGKPTKASPGTTTSRVTYPPPGVPPHWSVG